MTTQAIVSTYGPTSYGFDHDTTTEGPIKKCAHISTLNGARDFSNALTLAVGRYDLRRGDKIKITIVPAN